MVDVNLKLHLEVTSPTVLPEIVNILNNMIEIFNSRHSETLYVKLLSDCKDSDTTRHQKFDSADQMLVAIENNCPVGCNIIYNF